MIIWGGEEKYGALSNGGAKYNPKNGVWTSISSMGAPSSRSSHTAVWTGTEMIIWGGGSNLNGGARYDPNTNTWVGNINSAEAPLGRSSHSAVWTGKEMIIWGGVNNSTYLNTGAKYNPISNSWTSSITTNGAPSTRIGHTAVWDTNRQVMLVWGGNNVTGYLNDLYQYFLNYSGPITSPTFYLFRKN
jgi:hypothetical protein